MFPHPHPHPQTLRQRDQPGARPAAQLIYRSLPNSPSHHPTQQLPAHRRHLQQQQHQHQQHQQLQHQQQPQRDAISSGSMFRTQSFSSLMPTPSQHTQHGTLLRRKTPSGTLPAAYDAAPMEWTTRPSKHILLPLPNINGQPIHPDHGGQAVGWEKSTLPISSMEENMALRGADVAVGTGGGFTPMLWAPLNSQVSLDENLDPYVRQFLLQQYQIAPSIHENIFLGGVGGGRMSGLQQLYTPIIPPTASCDDINSFIMGGGVGTSYNPIPRDSNWYGHYGSWGNGHTTPTQFPQAPQAPLYHINAAYAPVPQQINVAPMWPPQILRADATNISGFPPYLRSSTYSMTPQPVIHPEPQLHHGHLLSDIVGPFSGVPSQQQQQQQPNPNYQEEILAWAHGVYIDLLASMKSQQRQGAGNTIPHTGHTNRCHQNPINHGIYARQLQSQPNGLRSTLFPSQQPPSNGSANPKSRDFPLNRAIISTDECDDRRKRVRPNIHHESTFPDIRTSSSHSSVLFTGDEPAIRDSNNPNRENGIPWLSENAAGPGSKKPAVNCYSTTTPFHYLSQDLHNSPLAVSTAISGNLLSKSMGIANNQQSAMSSAVAALEMLDRLCSGGGWTWVEGMLLGGCLAYGLGDLNRAMGWYFRILEVDENHVEALSNLAATLLSLNRRQEAEQYWLRAVRKRPSYFEAVEHLVGLLCGEHRGKEAVEIINFVESSLRQSNCFSARNPSVSSSSSSESSTASTSTAESEVRFDYEDLFDDDKVPSAQFEPPSKNLVFGQSEFLIPGSDNGRMLALIHAKGNMLYTLGDNEGAAKAFEDAVLVGAGRHKGGIRGLINRILIVLRSAIDGVNVAKSSKAGVPQFPVLLTPDKAIQTARLVFAPNGELPGLRDVPNGVQKRAAISTTSNSLLSLAKIFQDAMSSGGSNGATSSSGVKDILALYYLSLSLHPSPSTANNVGILLASVQQVSTLPNIHTATLPNMPGVVSGTGIQLALAYYYYGLNLDSRHAHLYTNLGSLLKDINHLSAAIKMYEQAVACDGTFDIALANLANAVKDQGRISDAIGYYRRAVKASPDFAEAVCGLANALNSVCDWKGRGGIVRDGGNRDRWHVDDDGTLVDAKGVGAVSSGWMKRVVEIVEKQLADGEHWGKGVMSGEVAETLLKEVENANGANWPDDRRKALRRTVKGWAGKKFEGAKVIRLIERAARRAVWKWYQEKYVQGLDKPESHYRRPTVPSTLTTPSAPTVLPFHTFTCPLSAKQVRMISQRNGLRISCSTLRSPWLPATVYPPPAPPAPFLKVGYVSSDFNNHPLAHLMQSVFGYHDPSRVRAYCYATTTSDNSDHRKQIERESPVFYDAHSWGPDRLVKQIVEDGIHILINLNGFTRGARNEIFAARPAPIQMSFMGFAGTLGAEWCDYLYADSTAVPAETLRPWRRNVDIEDGEHEDSSEDDDGKWVYSENIIFARYSFFCCDHRQSAPDAKLKQLSWEEEQQKRWKMRNEMFPQLKSDAVILANFNQLYKIEPTTFRTWLRILARVPKAVLWLLRFPDLGESNLLTLATAWAGSEVASRILFTDVAPKPQHILRAQICDVFLDTPECNAHTTAADVLWSGTPLLTLPRHKHKMCSRIAASILRAAVPQTTEGRKIANRLITENEEDYENRAVELASGMVYNSDNKIKINDTKSNDGTGAGDDGSTGELKTIRKVLFENRRTSPLFDTRRWVRDLEDAYEEAWRKWVSAEGGDIFLKDLKRGGY